MRTRRGDINAPVCCKNCTTRSAEKNHNARMETFSKPPVQSRPVKGNYPIADTWFSKQMLNERLSCIVEPYVHVLERANMFLIEGSERDLILDTGMGVVPLKPYLDSIRQHQDKELVCVSSHTHIDHIGGVHEFDIRLVHPAESDEMANPSGMTTLFCEDIPQSLIQTFLDAGYPPLDELMISAYPYPQYDPSSYKLRGAKATGLLEEGNTVDLGDRLFHVLHLPGHSPGGIGLYDERNGVLFAADAIYDGPLIYEGPGMSVPDYIQTFRKLRSLDVSVVHGGHDPSFDAQHMHKIIDRYMSLWGSV